MPTRPAWLASAAGVFIIVAGRLFGLPELFIMGTALIVSVLSAVALVSVRPVHLVVERILTPSEPHVGDSIEISLRLTAESKTPPCEVIENILGAGQVYVSLAPLPAGKSIQTSYRHIARSRGLTTFGPITGEVVDPLGLSTKTRTLGPATEVVVLPRIVPLELPDIDSGSGELVEALRRLATRQPPSLEFRAIREYAPGDDPRRINWKASAKRDDLVVNDFETESTVDLCIAFDTRESFYTPDGFERATSVVASLVHAYSDSLDGHDLFLSLSAGEQVFPDINPAQSLAILRYLALVAPDHGSTPGVLRRDPARIKVDVFVVGAIDRDWVRLMWNALGSARVVVVIACDFGTGSPELPPHWFFLSGPDLDSLALAWSHLCHRSSARGQVSASFSTGRP